MIFQSICFYATIIVISSLFAEKCSGKAKWNTFFFLLAVLIPAVVAGLRYKTGTDYSSYKQLYEEIAAYGHSISTPKLELGFVLICRVCNVIGIGFQGMLFLIAFITYYYSLKAIKSYENHLSIGLAYFIYLLFYFQPSFNLIRQAAAMSITLYSISILKDGKMVKCVLYILIASLIHSSAVVILMPICIYLLYVSRLPTHYKTIGIVILCIIMIFYDKLFSFATEIMPFLARYNGYIDKSGLKDFGLSIFIRYGFILIPFFAVYRKYKKEMRITYPFFILVIGFIFRLSTYASQTVFAFRMTYYFQMFQILCIPMLVHYFNKHRYIKGDKLCLISMAIVTIAISFWIYDSFILMTNETVPYISILSGC
jgi:transmembrane protein EpsG